MSVSRSVLISPEALIGVRGPWVGLLEDAGFSVQYPEDPTFTRGLCGAEETIRVLNSASAVIAGGEYFTEPVLDRLPNLRVIARAGVGYDRVDVAAATARRIPLTITPTANHESVAETTLALLFAVAKGIVANDARTRAGQWAKQATEPIRGKTLGIFGLGRIGRSTAIRARALGMIVLATEKFPNDSFVRQHGIELVDFDALLARSDYVSIHCPLNAETNRLFDRTVFSRMKPGSVLLNTARGGLVVEADLLEALRSGQLGGAGLDVFEQEPASAANPLFQLDNVVVSPHLGGADKLSQHNMAIEAADCIVKLSRGEWPAGAVVNDELRENWKW
jgi:phosphoglycerate dehydrogenase-like enzyme